MAAVLASLLSMAQDKVSRQIFPMTAGFELRSAGGAAYTWHLEVGSMLHRDTPKLPQQCLVLATSSMDLPSWTMLGNQSCTDDEAVALAVPVSHCIHHLWKLFYQRKLWELIVGSLTCQTVGFERVAEGGIRLVVG